MEVVSEIASEELPQLEALFDNCCQLSENNYHKKFDKSIKFVLAACANVNEFLFDEINNIIHMMYRAVEVSGINPQTFFESFPICVTDTISEFNAMVEYLLNPELKFSFPRVEKSFIREFIWIEIYLLELINSYKTMHEIGFKIEIILNLNLFTSTLASKIFLNLRRLRFLICEREISPEYYEIKGIAVDYNLYSGDLAAELDAINTIIAIIDTSLIPHTIIDVDIADTDDTHIEIYLSILRTISVILSVDN